MNLLITILAFWVFLVNSQSVVTVYTTVGVYYILSTKGDATPTTTVKSTVYTGTTTITRSLSSTASTPLSSIKVISTSSPTFAATTPRVSSSSTPTPSSSTTSRSTTTSTTTITRITSTTTTTVKTASSTNSLPAPTDFASTGTFYHNKHRLNHSAPLMTWNTVQANNAAQIARSCVFAHNMNVNGGGYGQNIAAYGSTGNVQGMSPSLMLAKSITEQWYYGEVNNYLPYYGQPSPDMNKFGSVGHFTQIVWKASTTVGCASQFCPKGTIWADYESWFTVCNYVAQGNYLGDFGTNVGRPLGQPAITVA